MIAPAQLIAIGALIGLGLAMAAIFARLIFGPALHDRILAAHAFMLKAALALAALGVFAGQAAWIDAALTLFLVDVALVAAALKFLRYRTFQTALAQADGVLPDSMGAP